MLPAEEMAPVGKPGVVIKFEHDETHHYAPETFSGTAARRKFVVIKDGHGTPVTDIAQLELGSLICHIEKGEGVVSEFKAKTNPRKPSPLEKLAQESLGPEDERIVKQLREWDVNGDGEYDVKEVLAACKHFMHEKETVSHLKKSIVAGAAISLLVMGTLMGLMVASIEATKESRTEKTGVLLTPGGSPVTVTSTDIEVNIFDIAYMDAESIKSMREVIINNDDPNFEATQYVVRVGSAQLIRPGLVVLNSPDGYSFKIDAQAGSISMKTINQCGITPATHDEYVRIYTDGTEGSVRRSGLGGLRGKRGGTSARTRFHRHRL